MANNAMGWIQDHSCGLTTDRCTETLRERKSLYVLDIDLAVISPFATHW